MEDFVQLLRIYVYFWNWQIYEGSIKQNEEIQPAQ